MTLPRRSIWITRCWTRRPGSGAQEVLDRFPEVAVEAYHIDNVIHGVRPNAFTHQHEHITKVLVTEAPTLLDVPLPLGKLLFEAEHEVLERVQQTLVQEGWDRDYELIFSGKTLLEMTAKGANKGGMVRPSRSAAGHFHGPCLLCRRRGQRHLHAHRRCHGFAPANCIQAVRDCGATIVSNAWEDAMADMVDILDKRY